MKELYTARWELTNGVNLTNGTKNALLSLLDDQLGPRPAQAQDSSSEILEDDEEQSILPNLLDYDIDEDGDVDRDDFGSPYNGKRVWCPWAEDLPNQKKRGRYETKTGRPVGAIVHFTAGHPDQKLDHMGRIAADSSFGYWCIDGEGRVGQANALDQWSSHAGKSYHKRLGRSVSRYLVGIEIACPGKVKDLGNGKVKSWFPRKFDKDDCRLVRAEGNRKAGLYFMYSEEQEESLVQALMWMKWNDPDNFDFDLILGHDEVAPTRKDDPGGSLSTIMQALRDRLKADWEELKAELRV